MKNGQPTSRRRLLSAFVSFVGAWCVQSHAAIPGFDPVPPEYSVVRAEVALANLPAPRDPIALGICGPAAATALIEFERCNQQKQNCTTLSDSRRPSLLDVARLAQSLPNAADQNDLDSYPRIVSEGAPGLFSLINAYFQTKEVSTEACAPIAPITTGVIPMDRGVSRAAQEKASIDLLARLRVLHRESRARFAACASARSSPDCRKDLIALASTQMNVLLGTSKSVGVPAARVGDALGAESFEEFIGRLLIDPACSESKNLLSFASQFQTLRYWPLVESDRKLEASLLKIESVLRSNHLVIVDFVCLKDGFARDKNCLSVSSTELLPAGTSLAHTTVISGVRQMCNRAGECMGAVRILNSWGQRWQDENAGGWVRASKFFAQTGYPLKNLAWIEDVDPSASPTRR
ncbi:hypothetical protein FFI97_019470 [Variovorax sp. KBS0712]|uniref:hypothetical protein n=1 Tax=Variovorax sp. KBS0712 TaxID=2578111 RepID=UPI001117C1C6|nr:hypothetical protein [Variovorax sp. KBS0712]TSD56414.1 hypothetical protein FFI97_019470 [Variovorax sp. KBS0712]